MATACIKLPVDASRLDVMCSLAALEPGESLTLPDLETDGIWTCERRGDEFAISGGNEDRGVVASSIAEALDWLVPVAD